jgi:outer membrane protein assembly factor BamE (lipoprotein component of BamABCDE complex)
MIWDKMYAHIIRLTATGLLIAGMAACSDNIDPRGNFPLPDRLEQIQPGRVTRSDVVALIGTPATVSLFGDDHWYYIGSHFQTNTFHLPEELDRQVIAIDFDRSGNVIAVRHLGLEEGKLVAMVPRETPAPGKELSFLEQLIGSVGKFGGAETDKAAGP